MARQQADPDFRPRVNHPVYDQNHGPVVLVDEGHHNFHTAAGRYRALAQILAADGYVVRRSPSAFTAEALADARVVIIATPFNGLERSSSAGSPEEAATEARRPS